jgi:hypothetical protein
MRAEKLLDGIRMRACQVGGNQRIEELLEPLCGARWKVVDRMRDDVGVNVLGELEANRKTAGAGALRIIIGNRWYSPQSSRSGPSPAWNCGADAAPASAKRLPTKA